jgi:hypothetical protein
MIVVVWILAGAITSPPLLGCFPRARNVVEIEKKCSYNMDSSYVVFSAMGSFFLPMLVMLYVYGRISCVIAKRHRSLESADAVSAGENRKSPNESINCSSAHRRSQRRHFHAVSKVFSVLVCLLQICGLITSFFFIYAIHLLHFISIRSSNLLSNLFIYLMLLII